LFFAIRLLYIAIRHSFIHCV